MRTRYDQFGKQMLRAALERRGPVESEAEVPASGTRRIDLWFTPDAAAAATDRFGLLGRITTAPSTIELFHDTPSAEDLVVTARDDSRSSSGDRAAWDAATIRLAALAAPLGGRLAAMDSGAGGAMVQLVVARTAWRRTARPGSPGVGEQP